MNILFCIGFTKNISSSEDEINSELWNILSSNRFEKNILTRSLYNFLCYLQSLEAAIEIPQELANENPQISPDNVVLNRFGVIFNKVFYLNPRHSKEKKKLNQNKLIKEFYSLLNNKKTFDRDNFKQSKA